MMKQNVLLKLGLFLLQPVLIDHNIKIYVIFGMQQFYKFVIKNYMYQ